MSHLSELATGNFGNVPKQKKATVSFCVKAEKPISLKATKTVKKITNPNKITMKPILSFAKVKKVSETKYCIYASTNQTTLNRIIDRLLAFNDMEISYSADLEGNELIKKSKKPLWAIRKSESGEFVLERCF